MKPNIPEGYKKLEKGEIIPEGAKFWLVSRECYIPVQVHGEILDSNLLVIAPIESSSMDVSGAKEAKQKCERDIKDLLNKFVEESGLNLDSVIVDVIEAFDSPNKCSFVKIKASV